MFQTKTLDPPRRVEAIRGLQWWRHAWTLFVRRPGSWVLLGFVFVVLLLGLSIVPLGGVLAALGLPALIAGALQAARVTEEGGAPALSDLWVAFQGPRLSPLLVLGALLCGAGLVLAAVAGSLGVGAVFGVTAGGLYGSAGGMLAGMAAGVLAMLLLTFFSAVLGMAFWFAPALVWFRGVAPVDALKASFAASWRNWLPFLLYALIYTVAAFVASVLFGLGWLVLAPVMLLTVYVSSVEVFDV